MDLEIFPSLLFNILIIFCPRFAMDLEKTNALNARQKEEYNKLTNDFNGLQV